MSIDIPGFENGFDAETVDTTDTFSPLPEGKYVAVIIKAELKETKAGTGAYLSLQLRITEGPFEGRVLFSNLNLANPNQQAVDIARRHLAQICKATGVMKLASLDEVSQFYGIPIAIRVKIRKATDMYPASNDISQYRELDGGGPEEGDDGSAPW
jgi:Protein of unknown function (DUF669)